jgi:hypothetical protein
MVFPNNVPPRQSGETDRLVPGRGKSFIPIVQSVYTKDAKITKSEPEVCFLAFFATLGGSIGRQIPSYRCPSFR